jgi:hypothetical protein
MRRARFFGQGKDDRAGKPDRARRPIEPPFARRRAVFEALESRLLLSATPVEISLVLAQVEANGSLLQERLAPVVAAHDLTLAQAAHPSPTAAVTAIEDQAPDLTLRVRHEHADAGVQAADNARNDSSSLEWFEALLGAPLVLAGGTGTASPVDHSFRAGAASDSVEVITRQAPPWLPQDLRLAGAQLVLLDLDGASDVTYEGPVTVRGIEVPAFAAPQELRGQEAAIVEALLGSLEQSLPTAEVVFTTEQPRAGIPYSTIHVGGDSSAFAEYGWFVGLAEKIDRGNRDPGDTAFVFSESILGPGLTATEYGQLLAGYVAHEAGHLLGFAHAHTVASADDPLATSRSPRTSGPT